MGYVHDDSDGRCNRYDLGCSRTEQADACSVLSQIRLTCLYTLARLGWVWFVSRLVGVVFVLQFSAPPWLAAWFPLGTGAWAGRVLLVGDHEIAALAKTPYGLVLQH